MIYFELNKFQKFSKSIDCFYFINKENKQIPYLECNVFNTSIFKSSLLNNKSVIISHELLMEIKIPEDKLIIITENLIYLSHRFKNLLPANIEFQSFTELKDQLYKIDTKKDQS